MKQTAVNATILILFSLLCGCVSASPDHDANNVKRINSCNDAGGKWVSEYNYCEPSKTAQKDQEKWINIELEKIRKQRQ